MKPLIQPQNLQKKVDHFSDLPPKIIRSRVICKKSLDNLKNIYSMEPSLAKIIMEFKNRLCIYFDSQENLRSLNLKQNQTVPFNLKQNQIFKQKGLSLNAEFCLPCQVGHMKNFILMERNQRSYYILLVAGRAERPSQGRHKHVCQRTDSLNGRQSSTQKLP